VTFSKLGTDTDTNQFVYLPKASRTKGVYILGLQGAGKSGLIENLCIEDGKQGTGFCVIDPHGELIDNVISRLPANREQDVILFDIRDYQYPFGLNLFTCSDPANPLAVQEVVDQVMHVFEMLVEVTPTTPQILDYLRNCTNVLIANPGYTMADVTLLLKNRTCRERLLQNVSDSSVLSFWHDYYDQMPPKEQISESISLERRVRHFLQALTVNIVGQSKTSVDFRHVMDDGKILLVKLDSLRLPSVTKLIGALIIALFLNAAPSRTKKNLFNIYADEFPLYATEDFVTLIEQARKQQIGLAMAHQNRGQLDARTSHVASKLRDRTLGTKQKIIFTITGQDADEVAGEFDITPQAAWEEEIEKEWVEVLKPEWYERVEEEVIDGTEPIETPVTDIVGWLLSGKGHSHEVVNQFAITLRKLNTDRQNKNSQIDTHFYQLNKLLYEAMVHQRLDTQLPIETLVYLLKVLEEPWVLPFDKMLYPLTKALYPLLLECITPHMGYHTPWYYNAVLQGVSALWTEQPGSLLWQQWLNYLDQIARTEIRETKLIMLSRELSSIMQLYGASLFETDRDHMPRLSNRTEQENIALTKAAWQRQHPTQTWYSIDIEKDIEKWIRLRRTIPIEMDWRQVSEKFYPNFYNPADLDRAVEAELQEQKTIFLNFLSELKQVMLILATPWGQIKAPSGLEQPRRRKQINYHTHPPQTITHPRKTIMHPQRPYQDVKNDIANQLSGLPNFTARVRLDETFPQNPGKICLSCKLLNNPGTKHCTGCGKELPTPNEYTIETIKPTGYLGAQQLQQRIQGIQARNRQKLYCRSKKDIEAEITKRQTSYSGGSAPAQPQIPPQQPPRHARQVPLQKHCSNCGASNAPGSKFCNQCGTKI